MPDPFIPTKAHPFEVGIASHAEAILIEPLGVVIDMPTGWRRLSATKTQATGDDLAARVYRLVASEVGECAFLATERDLEHRTEGLAPPTEIASRLIAMAGKRMLTRLGPDDIRAVGQALAAQRHGSLEIIDLASGLSAAEVCWRQPFGEHEILEAIVHIIGIENVLVISLGMAPTMAYNPTFFRAIAATMRPDMPVNAPGPVIRRSGTFTRQSASLSLVVEAGTVEIQASTDDSWHLTVRHPLRQEPRVSYDAGLIRLRATEIPADVRSRVAAGKRVPEGPGVYAISLALPRNVRYERIELMGGGADFALDAAGLSIDEIAVELAAGCFGLSTDGGRATTINAIMISGDAIVDASMGGVETLDIQSSAGGVELRLPIAPPLLGRISTGSGNVRIEAPTICPLKLSVSTRGGQVRDDRRARRGTYDGDVCSLTVESTSGNIEIEETY